MPIRLENGTRVVLDLFCLEVGLRSFPYVLLDATDLHVRRTGPGGQSAGGQVDLDGGGGRDRVTANGGREILGVDIGDSEDEVFWRGFLRTLRERGLSGVRLVISDQHSGLVAALGRQWQGVTHQRCRVHPAATLCVGPQVSQGHGGRGVSDRVRPARRRCRLPGLGPGP